MAITQASVLPQQFVTDIGQDYATQLAGLTAVPLDTSRFAPSVAGQDALQTQAAIREQAIADRAVAVGGFGGGREGVLSSEYQTQSDRNRALLNAQLLGQGFTQGAGLRQQDFANQLGLAGAQAGLAQGQMGIGGYQSGLAQLTPQLGRGDIATLTDIGGIQQAQDQRVLDAQAQANQMQAMEPYQRLGVYGQGLSRIGQLPGSISQQVTPDPTALQTALGTASVVGGLMGLGSGYSNLRAQQQAGIR